MDDKEYQIEMEREKTKRDYAEKIFWILFWVIVVTGCTVSGGL